MPGFVDHFVGVNGVVRPLVGVEMRKQRFETEMFEAPSSTACNPMAMFNDS